MTEKEYINLSYESKIKDAIKILSDINPELCHDINNEEYDEIMTTLLMWQIRFDKGVFIENK